MTIAGQRLLRDRRDAAVFVVLAPGDRVRTFDADLADDVLARDEVLRPDEARRVAPLTVFFVPLLAVLTVFATDLFAAGRFDRALTARFVPLAVRLAVLPVRLAVLAVRLAVLPVRLAVLPARFVPLAFGGIFETARFAVPVPRVVPVDVRLLLLAIRLAAATARDAARAERYVIVNRIWSPTA